jgi:hypothetical protein
MLDHLPGWIKRARPIGGFLKWVGKGKAEFVDVEDAAAALAINAANIANGTVSNTEFQYINGLTSAVQTQIDTKATKVAAPASASATGVAGTIATDTGYIYVCTATDTWKRVAIATWP